VAKMLQDSFARPMTTCARARCASSRWSTALIEATQAALASDGDLLTKVERDAIERLLADVSRSIATNELELFAGPSRR